LHKWDKICEVVAGVRLSSLVGIGSSELVLAGIDDSSLFVSDTVVGSNSVSGGTSLGMITGMATVAVDAQMLAGDLVDERLGKV